MKLKLICTTCNQECEHIQALLDHYSDKHPELLKRYSIKHKITKSIITMSAPNPDVILELGGWQKEDCKIDQI